MPKQCSLQWITINNSDGPVLQNHAGGIIQGVLYLHGGVTSNDITLCKVPSNCFYKIQLYPELGHWLEITSSDSPALSQHVCLVFKNRYLIFIGGWNGHTRISGVHTFDTQSNIWLPPALNEPLLSGFPQGAGFIKNATKSRKYYLLHGYLFDEDLSTKRMKYVYCEADSSLTTSSRSYHTSTAISSSTLLTIGGCKSNSVEVLKWKTDNKKKGQLNWPGSLDFSSMLCTVVTNYIKDIEKQRIDLVQLAPSNQNGWRGHCVVPGVGGLFIGTGEGFNALKNGPLNSAYLLKYAETGCRPIIYEIGTINEPRAYAVCAVCNNDGTAWLHGGLGRQGKTMNTLMKLTRVDV
ncbi:unnamed protein product [Heterobilharzia americana]|nr:unnamed protein product [Heterobilharzia americana]